MLIVVDNNRN